MSGLLALLFGALAIAAQELVPRALDVLADLLGQETVASTLAALPVQPAHVVAWGALLLCGWVLLGWVYHRYVRLYRVTPDSVEEHVGIVARQTRRVRLQHVRSVGLRQTFFGRLFNVGDLEFASSGTGEVDIVFRGIRSPATMRTHIQDLMNASHTPAR
ncbi:MAG: PH domain-containing protein [Thioalkalivibrio sp.]